MDGWYFYSAWLLPAATFLYFATFVRFYTVRYQWPAGKDTRWESLFRIILLVPLLECLFYLLFVILFLSYLSKGDERSAAESWQLWLLAPFLFLIKAASVAAAAGILFKPVKLSAGEYGYDAFYVRAKRQIMFIIVYTLIVSFPFLAFFLQPR